MTYRFEQRRGQQVVYSEHRQSRGDVTIWDEVIIPGIFIWALFLLGSLGLSFALVSAAKIPTNDDVMTMLGIALAISSVSSLLAWGLLWDSYQLRVWSEEITEYDSNEPAEADNLWQQTGPRTINRTHPIFSSLILHDLALNCFNPDGSWKETEWVRRLPFEGIGITNVERKYQAGDIQREFVRIGWMIKIDKRFRWTAKGKRELWKHFPPTAQGYE